MKKFKCTQAGCDKSYGKKYTLTRHMKIHMGGGDCVCRWCEKRFVNNSALDRHEKTHSGIKPYPCPHSTCGKRFAEKNNLKQHLGRMHAGQTIVNGLLEFERTNEIKVIQPAENINEDFAENENKEIQPLDSSGAISSHSALEEKTALQGNDGLPRHPGSEQEIAAVICGLQSITQLSPPLESEQTNEIQAIYNTGDINEDIDSLMFLERVTFLPPQLSLALRPRETIRNSQPRNKNKVKKNFCCDFPGCQKGYDAKFTLNRHKKTHLSGTDYCCNWCSKQFVNQSALERHERIHSGFKPHLCPHIQTCGKRFAERHNLKVHMIRIHQGILPLLPQNKRKSIDNNPIISQGFAPPPTKTSKGNSAYNAKKARLLPETETTNQLQPLSTGIAVPRSSNLTNYYSQIDQIEAINELRESFMYEWGLYKQVINTIQPSTGIILDYQLLHEHKHFLNTASDFCDKVENIIEQADKLEQSIKQSIIYQANLFKEFIIQHKNEADKTTKILISQLTIEQLRQFSPEDKSKYESTLEALDQEIEKTGALEYDQIDFDDAEDELKTINSEQELMPEPDLPKYYNLLQRREILLILAEKYKWDVESEIEQTGWYDNDKIIRLLQQPAVDALQQNPPVFLCVQPVGQSGNVKNLQRTTLKMMKMFLTELIINTPTLICTICRAWGAASGSHFIVNMLIENTLVIIDPLGRSGFKKIVLQQIKEECKAAKIDNFVVVTTQLQADKTKEKSCGPLSLAITDRMAVLGYARIKQWLTQSNQSVSGKQNSKKSYFRDMNDLLAGIINEDYEKSIAAIESEHKKLEENFIPESPVQTLFTTWIMRTQFENVSLSQIKQEDQKQGEKGLLFKLQTALPTGSTASLPNPSASASQLLFQQAASSSSNTPLLSVQEPSQIVLR